MNVLTRMSSLVRSEGDPRVIRSGNSSLRGPDQLARALGWFSIALGVSQALAAPRFSRALGVQGRESLVRACGLREIGHGVLTLSTERKAGLWSRVGGDALDMALLSAAFRSSRKRGNVALALALVAGITALDVFGARATTTRHSRRRGNGSGQNYRDRSGYPHGIERARGAARNVQVPSEMTTEPLLNRTSQTSRHTSEAPESPMPTHDPYARRH